MNRKPNRLGSFCVIGLFAVACSEPTQSPLTVQLPRPEVFTDLIRPIRQMPLGSAGDSIETIGASALTPRSLVVLDRGAVDVRLFDLSGGRSLAAVGSAGDNPGQFRNPYLVATLDSGAFVVLDQGRRILSFRDSLGQLQKEVNLPPGMYSGMVADRAQHRLIVAGKPFGPRRAAFAGDLHEFDFNGRHIRSYGHLPKPTSDWASRFTAEFAAMYQGEVVTGLMNGSRLRFYDPRRGSERWVTVAPGWQHLEWPSDGLLKRTASKSTVAERLTAWERQNVLMNGVFPLGRDRLLVRYQGFPEDGSRFYYYVLADTLGKALAITHATRVTVLGTKDDTIFWVPRPDARPQVLAVGIVKQADSTSDTQLAQRSSAHLPE